MTSPIVSGIQFIGTQRSGSNLMRVMLEQHPAIAAPHPPHLLHNFLPLMSHYEPLNEKNYALLVSDMVDYVNANPVPWEGVTFDKADIITRSKSYHIFEVFRLIYEGIALAKGARYWCCKSMQNLFYSNDMEQFGLNLKYIFLYRDGRDVALSFKKAIVGDKHVYFLAKQWKEEQDICLKLYRQFGNEKVFLMNYEKLVATPETCMKELCTFLDVAYQPEMLQYYRSDASKAAAAAGEMWKNLEKPVMKENTQKFLKELSADEIEIFEWVAKDTLVALGYPLYSSLSQPSLVSAEMIRLYQEENAAFKQQFLKNAPRNDVEKRTPQLQLLNTIRARTK